jgi:predicted RNase H-like HicB family nuclease
MRGEYTALLKQDGDWWIGWIEEVPGVNCQERTRDELLESLRETLREALQFNREDPFAKLVPATMKSSSPYETAGFAGALDPAWLQAREGRRQAFLWENVVLGRRSAVPRHTEISDILARKICKDLGVETPE